LARGVRYYSIGTRHIAQRRYCHEETHCDGFVGPSAGTANASYPDRPGRWEGRPRYNRGPSLSGTWYNSGDPNQPCEIRQRWGSNRALFINEKGSEAEGFIRGDRVFIPDWGVDEDGEGLVGVIRGRRIVWPDGNYWSR
jgi:hypothetical protein